MKRKLIVPAIIASIIALGSLMYYVAPNATIISPSPLATPTKQADVVYWTYLPLLIDDNPPTIAISPQNESLVVGGVKWFRITAHNLKNTQAIEVRLFFNPVVVSMFDMHTNNMPAGYTALEDIYAGARFELELDEPYTGTLELFDIAIVGNVPGKTNVLLYSFIGEPSGFGYWPQTSGGKLSVSSSLIVSETH